MKEDQKGYFERFCEFRQDVIAKIVETLGEKEVNLEEEEFRVVITERHCGEHYNDSVQSVSKYGFKAGGYDCQWGEMDVADLCCILDYLLNMEE